MPSSNHILMSSSVSPHILFFKLIKITEADFACFFITLWTTVTTSTEAGSSCHGFARHSFFLMQPVQLLILKLNIYFPYYPFVELDNVD
jgi:hypothetical protein